MKNLSRFNTHAIKTAEQSNIKGGIRFVTDKYGQAISKLNSLINEGLTYDAAIETCPETGETLYCIEW